MEQKIFKNTESANRAFDLFCRDIRDLEKKHGVKSWGAQLGARIPDPSGNVEWTSHYSNQGHFSSNKAVSITCKE